jgi:hypothetical protein
LLLASTCILSCIGGCVVREPGLGVIPGFPLPAGVIPTELWLDDGANLIKFVQPAAGQRERKPHPAREKIIEMDDALRAGRPAQLGPEGRKIANQLGFRFACALQHRTSLSAVAPKQPSSGGRGKAIQIPRQSGKLIQDACFPERPHSDGQPAPHSFQCVDSHCSEGGQFAAGQSHQALFIPQDVLARFLRGVFLARIKHAAHSSKGALNVRLVQRRGRESPAQAIQQIINLSRAHRGLAVDVFGVIDVRCPEQRYTLPGNCEDRPAVRGMEEGHGSSNRQTLPGKDKVSAAQLAQPRSASDAGPQPICPCPGCVDNYTGPDLDTGASIRQGTIRYEHSVHFAIAAKQEFIDAGVVKGECAICDLLADDAQHEAGIIGLSIEVAVAADQPLVSQRRTECPHRLG